ncbi:MAG: energy transducer TonB [Sphingomicrobium sp.]
MLAYAADRRRIAERHSSPRTLLLIAAAHIALIAAVMSARLDLPQRVFPKPIIVTSIAIPQPPPPEPVAQKTQTETKSIIAQTPTIVPLPKPANDDPDKILIPPNSGGEAIGLLPRGDPLPILDPVRVGPRFATPPSQVRPPYPPSKLDREEEAVLRLKLTIDAGGRVIAVNPVGKADPAFLAAARRHLIAHWRYRPATEDGRAIASVTVITLRFELNE